MEAERVKTGKSKGDPFLYLVDIGLAGVIFVAPMFMAGRHPLGAFVYVAVICLTATAWTVSQMFNARRSLTRSGAEAIILMAGLLLFLQLTPLSPTWLTRLSPQLEQLLPMWASGAEPELQLGIWSQITLVPQATRTGLVMFLAYAMLFAVVFQRVQKIDDVERLLRWIGCGGVGMAVLGLVQYLGGNGKFLWIYEHPFRDTLEEVKGPFANANHYAHFLALSMGPLIWWLQKQFNAPVRSRSWRENPATLKGQTNSFTWLGSLLAPAIVLFACLLTFSRGGMLVATLAAGICITLYTFTSHLAKRTACTLCGVAVLVAIAVSIHGYRPLAQELKTVSTTSLEQIDHDRGRRKIWAADLKAVADFPVVGAGVGSHREIYPIYFAELANYEYTHAESGYLNLLVETGFAGLSLMFMGIFLCGRWCLQTLWCTKHSRLQASAVAISASLAVSVVHSVFDFVWYIPACMTLTIVLAALIAKLHQLASPLTVKSYPIEPKLRYLWAVASLLVIGVSTCMIHHCLAPAFASPHWDQYLATSLATRAGTHRGLTRSLGTLDANDRQTIEQRITYLHEFLRHDPDNARANLRLASLYTQLFDVVQQASGNAMGLSQIRDAAIASQFNDRQQQDEWLARAVGDNRRHLDKAAHHARRAVALCPLQGKGYVLSADLAFLNLPEVDVRPDFIAQAIQVRPYSGHVLFAAGKEAVLSGDLKQALEFWRRAFQRGIKFQNAIINTLGPQLPAAFFIDNFNMDREGTRLLYQYYQQTGALDESQVAAALFASKTVESAAKISGPPAADLWTTAHSLYLFLGDPLQALEAAEQAVTQSPNDWELRRNWALRLVDTQRYDQAIAQLKWCMKRRPDDQSILTALQALNRDRLSQSGNGQRTPR